jgi:hypothetical protein
MARGGDPKLTWLEDQLIALSLFEPFVGDFSQDLATVKSFLENKFPDFQRIPSRISSRRQVARGKTMCL